VFGLTELLDITFLVLGILEQLPLQRRTFPILEILHHTLRIGILPSTLSPAMSASPGNSKKCVCSRYQKRFHRLQVPSTSLLQRRNRQLFQLCLSGIRNSSLCIRDGATMIRLFLRLSDDTLGRNIRHRSLSRSQCVQIRLE